MTEEKGEGRGERGGESLLGFITEFAKKGGGSVRTNTPFLTPKEGMNMDF